MDNQIESIANALDWWDKNVIRMTPKEQRTYRARLWRIFKYGDGCIKVEKIK